MEDMKKEVAGKSRAEEMKEKYGKVYRVGATIEVDDETEKTVEFYFKRPSTASYDRYVKTTAQGATKALKTFLFDNVVAESEADLEADLEEFPALALSIGEKLLGMLGLSKQTNLKMLSEVKGNFVEAGLLEIHRFLPPALLEGFDIEEIGLDEFLRYVAKARYIQELEEGIVARAISEVFSE